MSCIGKPVKSEQDRLNKLYWQQIIKRGEGLKKVGEEFGEVKMWYPPG